MKSNSYTCKKEKISSYNTTNYMHQFLKFIFGIKHYMFRTVPLSIIRSFSTVHTAMVYVIQVMLTACEQDQDHDPARKLYDIYTTAVCTVEKLLMMDRGTVRNM